MSLNEILDLRVGSLRLGTLLSVALLLLACILAIHLLSRLVGRALERTKLENALKSFIRSCVKVGLWVLAALILADALGIPSATLVAALSVAGLALSLSLQSILSNVFSGFTILFTKPFASGDYVEVGAAAGEVRAIGLFYTTLRTPDAKEIHIPNGEVSASRVVNWSAEPQRRLELTFGLGYDCGPDAVRRALLAAAADDPRVLPEPAPEVVLSAYRSSSVAYTLRAWVHTPDYWPACFALNESARAFLERAGLSLAFDRLDVRLMKEEGEDKA